MKDFFAFIKNTYLQTKITIVKDTLKKLENKYTDFNQQGIEVKKTLDKIIRFQNIFLSIIPLIISAYPLIFQKVNVKIIFGLLIVFFITLFLGYILIDIWKDIEKKIYVIQISTKTLTKYNNLITLICQKFKEEADNKEVSEMIILDILKKIIDNRDGKYSIAIYESYKGLFWMPVFETNYHIHCTPKVYNKTVHNKEQQENKNYHFKNFCFFKCLQDEKEKIIKILKTRKEIEDELDNPSTNYNQYVCFSFKIREEHRIAIEMVAYEDSIFEKDDSINMFFDNLINEYIYLLNLVFSFSISKELKKEGEL